MRYQVPGTSFAFEIDDADLAFAGMTGFQPQHPQYAPPIQMFSERVEAAFAELADIEPPAPRFKDVPTLPRARIAPVLLAIAGGLELPPVQVERIEEGGAYQLRLVDGLHRYCASIAAGYTRIPVVFHGIAWCRPGS